MLKQGDANDALSYYAHGIRLDALMQSNQLDALMQSNQLNGHTFDTLPFAQPHQSPSASIIGLGWWPADMHFLYVNVSHEPCS
jgi:hypothetical protein